VAPPETPGAGVGAMRRGKKHGRWKERSDTPFSEWKDGKTVPIDYAWTELDYVDGVKQGAFVVWWGNGQRREDGVYVADKPDGPFRLFNREGVKVSEGTYRAGELDGLWQHYHDDGMREYVGMLADGKRHGTWEEYYPDGSPRARGSYETSERIGPWSLWDKAGIVERGEYRGGKRIGTSALATVEELDLSDNDLDELAVRVLARSPYLGKVRELAWSGNDADADELEPLREALPHAKIGDAPPRGNVVVIDASA